MHGRRRHRRGHGREAARLPDECDARGRDGRWEEAAEIRTSRGGRLAAGGIFRGKFRRSDESRGAGPQESAPRGAAVGGGDPAGGAQRRKGALARTEVRGASSHCI